METSHIKQQLKAAYNADVARRNDNEERRDEWKIAERQAFADIILKQGKQTLLELGSGPGIDAKFFQDQGLDVLATDLTEGMVEACMERGVPAQVLDMEEVDTLQRQFDCVFSLNALLHIPRKDLPTVLEKIKSVMTEEGLFYLGMYGGRTEETTFDDKSKMGMPRFFSFLTDEDLLEIVEQHFEVIDFHRVDFGSGDENFYFQSLLLRNS